MEIDPLNKKYKILLITAPAVFILDQLTKLIIVSTIKLGARIPVIPDFFDIVHFRNEGAAFGILSDLEHSFRIPFFYIVAAVAVVFIVLFYRGLSKGEKLLPFTLSLVVGGIAGNILDRVRIGSVVDFLSFHIGDAALYFKLFGRHFNIVLEWPAFNVADSAITVAMVLLVWSSLKRKHP